MRRILLFSVTILSAILSYGQTQTGIVRESSNTTTTFMPISDVAIRVKGYSNPTKSGVDGRFSIKLDIKKEGEGFQFLSIHKQGYELTDPLVVGRTYAYSSKIPQEITMLSTRKLNDEKTRIERLVMEKVEDGYRMTLDALNDSLSQGLITIEKYIEAQQLAQRRLDTFEPLVEAMADHYARTDLLKYDSLDIQINRFIINGDIEKADLLLSQKGNLDKRITAMQRQIDVYGKADSLIASLDDALRLRKEEYLRERDDIADDLYNKYAISLSRFDARKAGEYILLRAELDTTEIVYQLDAGAFACQYLADYHLAEILYGRAYHTAVNLYGEDGEMTAMCLNHLGGLYLEESRFEESVDCRKQALEIRKSIYGEIHPAVAACHNNLANIYYGMQDFAKALEHARKSVDIYGACAETDILDLSDAYSTLGGVFIATGDLEQSLSCYEKSVSLADSILGVDNAHSATALNGIAVIKDYTGETAEAIGYYLRTLETFKKIYGERHPSVATIYSNLGMSYSDIGKLDSAFVCQSKALDIRLKLKGQYNEDVATSLNNIGALCSRLKQYDLAVDFYGKALTVLETVLGTGNEHFAATLVNAGIVYYKKGDFDNALGYLYEAMSVYLNNPEAYGRQIEDTAKDIVSIYKTAIRNDGIDETSKKELQKELEGFVGKFQKYLQ